MARDLLKEIGAHRLPTHVKTKRVIELMALCGKKAIVTGAGGPDLGQACAHRLAGLGAVVAFLASDAASCLHTGRGVQGLAS